MKSAFTEKAVGGQKGCTKHHAKNVHLTTLLENKFLKSTMTPFHPTPKRKCYADTSFIRFNSKPSENLTKQKVWLNSRKPNDWAYYQILMLSSGLHKVWFTRAPTQLLDAKIIEYNPRQRLPTRTIF